MNKNPDKKVLEAHQHCTNQKEALQIPQKCGCFYCLRVFDSKSVTDWIITEKEEKAVCPHCGIDSVIGESSGYSITPEFLRQMHDYWFSY